MTTSTPRLVDLAEGKRTWLLNVSRSVYDLEAHAVRILRERLPTTPVIETYPRAVFRALGAPETSRRGPAAAAAALGRVVEGVETTQADELDAIAAALAAAEYARRAVVGLDGTVWRVAASSADS